MRWLRWRQLGDAPSRAGISCRQSKPALKRPAGATQRKVASHSAWPRHEKSKRLSWIQGIDPDTIEAPGAFGEEPLPDRRGAHDEEIPEDLRRGCSFSDSDRARATVLHQRQHV